MIYLDSRVTASMLIYDSNCIKRETIENLSIIFYICWFVNFKAKKKKDILIPINFVIYWYKWTKFWIKIQQYNFMLKNS